MPSLSSDFALINIYPPSPLRANRSDGYFGRPAESYQGPADCAEDGIAHNEEDRSITINIAESVESVIHLAGDALLLGRRLKHFQM